MATRKLKLRSPITLSVLALLYFRDYTVKELTKAIGHDDDQTIRSLLNYLKKRGDVKAYGGPSKVWQLNRGD